MYNLFHSLKSFTYLWGMRGTMKSERHGGCGKSVGLGSCKVVVVLYIVVSFHWDFKIPVEDTLP